MKKILLLIFSCLLLSCGFYKPEWPSESFIRKNNYEAVLTEEDIQQNPEAFEGKFDEPPMYPNGSMGVMKHIAKNYKFPEEARQKGVQGRVYVNFIINTEGRLENIRVVKSANELFNAEAIRVMELMERWIPAKLNGEYVNFSYTVPINLKLV